MALTLRSTKGSALTYAEMDANWSGLANGTNWGTITAAVTMSGGLTVSAGNLTISTGQLNFSTSSVVQEAADTLAQRNGVNAQALRVYDTFTDASNYRRAGISWSGAVVDIGSESAGTGAGGFGYLRIKSSASSGNTIVFNTNSGGQVDRWGFAVTGHLLALTDNTYDIGASAATRPRSLFLGTNITTGAPSGGTAAAWKLGTVAVVSPTSPNRTVEVEVGGTIYYVAAKTTNN